MTKRIMLISSVLLTIGIGIIVFYNVCNDNEIIESTNRDNLKVNSNALTMMYETEYESGEYQVSSDTMWPQEGYTFNAELSKCENGSKLSWDDENKKVLLQANTSDKCYVYFDKGPDTLADYIINNVYVEDGVNGLYYHDGVGSYTNANQEAGDYSYRYSGANPNNYVCFGSDEATCPTDNLYRIIGVFDRQVKLIKADYIGSDLLGTNGGFYNASYSGVISESSSYKGSKDQSTIPVYYRNVSGVNTWSESQLNTVNLNTNYINYLNNIDSKWTEMIATTEWNVGGNRWANIGTQNAPTAYQNEIVNPAESTTYSAKIGLMYVSDYMYGAAPTYWTYVGLHIQDETADYRAAINDNWMYMGLYEWTISKFSNDSYIGFRVSDDGSIFHSEVKESLAIRPSFYLQSWVQYSRGDGSQKNPFRLQENLISFSIDGTFYCAEEGMMWQDWIDSDYNDSDFTISDNNVLSGIDFKITLDGLLVNSNDEILSNTKYLERCVSSHSYCGRMHLGNTFYDFQYLDFTYKEHFDFLYEFDVGLIVDYTYYDEYTFSEFIDEIINYQIDIYNPLDNYNNVTMLSYFFHLSENEETTNAINDDGKYSVVIDVPNLEDGYEMRILHYSLNYSIVEFIEPSDINFDSKQIEFITEDLGLFAVVVITN